MMDAVEPLPSHPPRALTAMTLTWSLRGTYSHPDRGTPFDERSKEYRDRVRQELQHGRTRGDR